MRTILIRHRILGSLWWVQARVDDKAETAEVLGNWRDDGAGQRYTPDYIVNEPRDLRPLVESDDGKRTVTGLRVEDKVYNVTNPQNVFSYGSMKKVTKGKVVS